MAEDEDHEVGYGKPPKHTRFKKGQSGNPKGRPKGHRNFKTDVLEMLRAPVKVNENGQQRTVSTQLATLMRLREKALGGDAKTIEHLLRLAGFYSDDEPETVEQTMLPTSDLEILNAYISRRARAADPDTTEADQHRPGETEDDDGADR